MIKNVFIKAPAPYHTILIQCDPETTLCDIHHRLQHRLPTTLLESCYLHGSLSDPAFSSLVLSPRLRGGKGGFGAQLRSAGGRMRRGKANKDSMKDVSGRRVRTLKKAQALAEALRDAPEQARQRRKDERARLVAILEAEMPGSKIKFDDEDYLAQSETILEDIRNAMEEAYQDEESDDDVGTSSSFINALTTGYKEANRETNESDEEVEKSEKGKEVDGMPDRKRQRVE